MRIATHLTERFKMTIGVTPGYGHANEGARGDVVTTVSKAWQEIMEQVGRETGVYVSAVVTSGFVAYECDRGCPEGGEHVGIIQGVRNPEKCTDEKEWRDSLLRIVSEMQERFRQVTAQVVFDNVEMMYLSKK